MTTAAYTRVGNTGEYNLRELQEKLDAIYPGKAFHVFFTLPDEVLKLIGNHGFVVTVEDGDAYEKGQWLKVEDDFCLPEPEDSDAEWASREALDEKLSRLRQAYADALAMELLA